MEITKIPGGVTAAQGFLAADCAAGIKYENRTDMALLVSEFPCEVAGTFTTNLVKAAPVLWDQKIVYGGKKAQAVVVNAGIANAATGAEGLELCRMTAEFTGKTMNVPADAVLLGSTGVIGPQIPLGKITAGVARMSGSLSDSLEAGTSASKAIMTTDTVNKECAVSFLLPSDDGKGPVTVTLGGMAKGSGMIHPNMCTMLCYITTDCAIDRSLLQKALSAVVPDTFNMITVDGDTSTNDTLLLLANGRAGNKKITEEDDSYALFLQALFFLCRDLAITMAGDGEGATRRIETHVFHADTKENARILAKSVVASSLVKAMVFGRDANCGRILCALGYAGVPFDPDKVTVELVGEKGRVRFSENGRILAFDEDMALKLMSGKNVRFECDMNAGAEEATAWGCDLTYDYVKINGDYRS